MRVVTIRQFVQAFALILAGLQALPAMAGEPTVEFLVWARQWTGTLGSKQVEVSIRREGDNFSGSYCYQPCTNAKRYLLQLRGEMEGQHVQLFERDISARNSETVTGHWRLALADTALTGTWTAPDGRRTLPVNLTVVADETKAIPYEMRLVADALPANDDDCHPPHVSAIRLYKDGQLAQTLPTDSQGSCGIYIPEAIDANFDGWPDLTLALFLPAGPNIPHQTWLYDPETGLYKDAPQGLQDITSPIFDPVHKIIWTAWRSSCCEHGVTTYRWQGDDVVEVDTRSSYLLPVLDGEELRYCYVTPDYDNGAIVFPGRVEQTATGLNLHGIDLKECDSGSPSFTERTYIDIWKPDGTTLLRTEQVEWRETDAPEGALSCPEVPFYDNGAIRRVLISDDVDLCSETDPRTG
ncbi:XAC2610-related protein [Pseudomonas sp.]|uniref:XAC2610-related protein n=1 Tax=Pseudomonas sp. TaxID=306 RepID=UPI003D0FC4E0